MPTRQPFYSINEAKKAPANRFYHNNSECPTGRAIPQNERLSGRHTHRLCPECDRLNRAGR